MDIRKGKDLSTSEKMKIIDDLQHAHFLDQAKVEHSDHHTLIIMNKLTNFVDFDDQEIKYVAILSSN